MNRAKRIATALFCGLFWLTGQSACDTDGGLIPDEPDSQLFDAKDASPLGFDWSCELNEPRYAGETIVISPDIASELDVREDSVLMRRELAATLRIEDGSILFGGSRTQHLLRRVKSISPQGSLSVLETEPVPFVDAVDEYCLQIRLPDESHGALSIDGGLGFAFGLPLDISSDAFSAEGGIEMNGGLGLGVEVKFGKIQRFELIGNITLAAWIEPEITIDGIDGSLSLELGLLPEIPLPIGIAEVFADLSIEVDVELDCDSSAGLSGSVRLEGSLEGNFRLTYVDGQFVSSPRFTATGGVSNFSLGYGGAVECRLALQPGLELDVWPVLEVDLGFGKVYDLSATADLLANSCDWEFGSAWALTATGMLDVPLFSDYEIRVDVWKSTSEPLDHGEGVCLCECSLGERCCQNCRYLPPEECTTDPGVELNCFNGVDDDGDSLVDCVDPDCVSQCQICCQAGEMRCLSNTVQQTCAERTGDSCPEWGDDIACASGICSIDKCTAACDACTRGVRRCASAAIIEECADLNSDGCAEWNSSICSFGCQSNTCLSCANECLTQSETNCVDSSTARECEDVDGDGCLEWRLTPCSFGCLNDKCASCADECSTFGASVCADPSTQKTCGYYDSDGCLDLGETITCALGCTGTSCTSCANECTVPGSTTCLDGTTLQICGNYDAEACLEWGDNQTCAGICSNNSCACQDDCPNAGAQQCINSSTLEVCGNYDTDSCLELQSLNCPFGCLADSCLNCTNECNSGETHCIDGTTQESCGNFDSDACLEWGGVTTCPSICSGIACATCTNECLSQGSFGCESTNTVRTCGDTDLDPCLEWQYSTCPSNTEFCDAGTCVAVPTVDVWRYVSLCSSQHWSSTETCFPGPVAGTGCGADMGC